MANLSITGHLRCFSDQPVADIVQCDEPPALSQTFKTPAARVADNGGCDPPQIPLSKSHSLRTLQSTKEAPRFEASVTRWALRSSANARAGILLSFPSDLRGWNRWRLHIVAAGDSEPTALSMGRRSAIYAAMVPLSGGLQHRPGQTIKSRDDRGQVAFVFGRRPRTKQR